MVFDYYILVFLDCCLCREVGLGGGGCCGFCLLCDIGRLVGLGGVGGLFLFSVLDDFLRGCGGRDGGFLVFFGIWIFMELRMLVVGFVRSDWVFMDFNIFFIMLMLMLIGLKLLFFFVIDFFFFVLVLFYKEKF